MIGLATWGLDGVCELFESPNDVSVGDADGAEVGRI